MSIDKLAGSVVENAKQLLRTGQAQQALKHLLAIYDEDNIRADYWLTLGLAYAQTGDLVKAEKSFRKTVQLEPNHFSALTNMGRALATQGKAEQSRQ